MNTRLPYSHYFSRLAKIDIFNLSIQKLGLNKKLIGGGYLK